MTRVVLVDQSDTPIGLKERSELGPDDCIRASAIWITNSKGDILLAQRALNKKSNPGKWSTAVAGAVDEGEDYDDNAVKEAQEELGLSIDVRDMVKGPKRFVKVPSSQFFCQWYFYKTDILRENLVLQVAEVADARWFSREELEDAIRTEPEKFFGDSAEWMKELLAMSR